MNGDGSAAAVQVTVNQRALVDKVLARYPEEFTVFRELVQNADDARAENVVIEFQTEAYAKSPASEKMVNGVGVDLNKAKAFKWIVKNDGEEFEPRDWNRLTSIAEGNPDDQKIGAFGVGFFSVFSVTECPVVISGGEQGLQLSVKHLVLSVIIDHRKRMFYQGDQLMVQSNSCTKDKWTTIEMELKEELQIPIPKPFDLSRFLCAAVTFLVKIKKITMLFDGKVLSEITKSRGEATQVEQLPKYLRVKSNSGAMTVKSVEMIPQTVQVSLTDLGYSAGSKKPRVGKPANDQEDSNPAKRSTFFGTKKNTQTNGIGPNSMSRSISSTSTSNKVSVVQYTIYSAQVSTDLPKDMFAGLKATTKKDPPKDFLYEAVHFNLDEYRRAMQDGTQEGSLGSVFRGAQALCSEEADGHGSRIFIGQSTAQTTGIAVHLSSRFIPTVERGSIDLANGQVARWNEELMYVGGYLTRLIYERTMNDIRDRWPASPSPLKDQLRDEALYIMRCFTTRNSTPDSKVSEALQKSFFDCSDSHSFPILSNVGIRDSKDVRQPHQDFSPFMKERPVLDNALWPTKSTLIEHLPKKYEVTVYTFRDVKAELEGRTFSEDEMIACVGWWVKTFGKQQKQASESVESMWKKEFAPVAKFSTKPTLHSPSRVINLSAITKFVDTRPRFSFVQNDDPLPPDTIPIPFTRLLDSNQVMAAIRWEYLTVVDWIRYLTAPGLDPAHDISKSYPFCERVLLALRNLWPSLKPADREQVTALMQAVPCIPTNKGHRKPKEVYFLEADVFNELPVVPQQLYDFDIVLDDLGVNRYLEWNFVRERLLMDVQCSMSRLVSYLQEARRYMEHDIFMAVKELEIFVCEAGTRHCIRGLYRPDNINRTLGLPVLHLGDAGGFGLQIDSFAILEELGMQTYPSLAVVIEKASSGDTQVKSSAFNYLVNHLDDIYQSYNPADYAESAYLPCGKGPRPSQWGTPEQVFTSPEWEVLGFHTIHRSVPPRTIGRLKVKERPSAAAIIKALQQNPPKTRVEAKKQFDLLARRGGFSADELTTLSEMDIVPIAPNNTSPAEKMVAPGRCFYDTLDQTKAHHQRLFTFVNFNQPANGFLKMCGAKANPDHLDIVEAMIDNPQDYLDKAGDHKKYLDDLRQVAAGYHSLPKDTRQRMKRAPIFLSFRKKPRAPNAPLSQESLEYTLKLGSEVLLADDMESHRLFGEHVYVAPKEEVFENFYRDNGSGSLSAHVKHEVQHSPHAERPDEKDLRGRVLERVGIFLHDQDSTRRTDFNVHKWKNPEAFTVKHCKRLDISKRLEFEHVIKDEGSQPLVPIREPALAGIERADDDHDILWLKPQPDKRDWYDVSVALCRIIFKTHKTHDTLLLMTILDAQMDDLRRRGYDVDAIRRNNEEDAQRAQPKPEESSGQEGEGSSPDLPHSSNKWLKLPNFLDFKKKSRSGEFTQGGMEDMVDAALELCASDAELGRTLNHDDEKSKGGKKLRDVKYCASRTTDLSTCDFKTNNGMIVSKAHGSTEPPKAELELFSVILAELGQLFGLIPEKLHIFWHEKDVELMGFNRKNAIYLNLAHYKEKHHSLTDKNSTAVIYAAWYFILAHEIAHNKAFFHDEDHELLFSSLAQSRLTKFRHLLDEKARK
ncbi:hypothetical protein HYDPIDRAFT_26903 [Hydnomerulius pinastri MD-312]|nr:hypothetical protein HYDPIDRAFT_26903 [Hydnomerulius pinastri MD-312]